MKKFFLLKNSPRLWRGILLALIGLIVLGGVSYLSMQSNMHLQGTVTRPWEFPTRPQPTKPPVPTRPNQECLMNCSNVYNSCIHAIESGNTKKMPNNAYKKAIEGCETRYASCKKTCK